MVRTDTVFYPGHDAALIRVKGTRKGIAVSTDCNSLYCYLDPYEGGKIAVAEAARNVVCSGAKPLAVTNCLNFGNPMKPDVFWQFHRVSEGMTEACKIFETPVTGGNVSFYNESPSAAVYPTPVIGMVGLLDDIDRRVPSFFQKKGDLIFMIGDTLNEIGGSHYLMIEHGLQKGLPPRLDLMREKTLYGFLLDAAAKHFLSSCHDLSEGGLAVALAECCLNPVQPIGAIADHTDIVLQRLKLNALRPDALYFGESQSRVVISVHPDHKEAVIKLAQKHNAPFYQIGKTGGEILEIGDKIKLPIGEIADIYRNAIPKRMNV
jgi:phosphoribosylformylglycinamidine synthase